MTPLAKWILLTSSYSPLLIVFALLGTMGEGTPALACAALAVLSMVGLAILLLALRTQKGVETSVRSVARQPTDALSYVATYLVPFVGVQASTWQERAALLVLLGVIAALYVSGDLYYLNPWLALSGFRQFQVQVKTGSDVARSTDTQTLLLRRAEVIVGEPLQLHRLTGELMLGFRGESDRA